MRLNLAVRCLSYGLKNLHDRRLENLSIRQFRLFRTLGSIIIRGRRGENGTNDFQCTKWVGVLISDVQGSIF